MAAVAPFSDERLAARVDSNGGRSENVLQNPLNSDVTNVSNDKVKVATLVVQCHTNLAHNSTGRTSLAFLFSQ